MWKEIVEFFGGAPAKLKVARLMVDLGFSINEKKRVVCGEVEISDSSIAKVSNVDRRVVRETVLDILGDSRMKKIFLGIKPAGSFLRDVAPALGYGVVEVRARPDAVGVIAKATSYIADAGVSIRQILAEDPDFNPDPKLLIITEKQVPGEVVSKLLTIPTVTKVSLS
ncbi:MAG: amino acid-binding protein [Candidatus Verstraetearchaeota archaeon]|nr:amino acid-binding protein [Candidatus Verstraetearchaeota archaeon]